MQLAKTFFLFISITLLPSYLFSQTNSNTYECYIDSIKTDEGVFHKIELNANFKGGSYQFKNFLIKNINHNIFIDKLSKNQPFYSDTAKVKFVISKKAIMSNLQIKGTKNDIFKSEIEKALKHSSCLWEPGTNGGRKINGWYQYDFFYFVELKNGEVNITLNYKPYSFADDK